MKGVPSGPTPALAAPSETSSPVWGRCGCGWHAPGTGPYLPPGLHRLERRAAEVWLLIREAFLRGLSPRAVGRGVALLIEAPVRAQRVSGLTRDVDHAVAQFPQASLADDWRYLVLEGVRWRGRRPSRPSLRGGPSTRLGAQAAQSPQRGAAPGSGGGQGRGPSDRSGEPATGGGGRRPRIRATMAARVPTWGDPAAP
jgi:hypothetical protein